MGMCVEEDIDVRWRRRWRDVDEPKTDPVANQIDYQGPFKIGIAIATHQGHRWPEVL